MPESLTPILIGLGALLLGWVIGFFDSNLRTSKKIKEAETKADAAIKEAQEKVADAESRLAVMSAAVPEVKAEESLLRLKKEGDGIVLEMDGQNVSMFDVSADQRKRLIGLLTVIRPWIEGGAVQQTLSRPAAPQQTLPGTVSSLQRNPAMSAPLVMSAKAEPEKPAPRATSIVEQIDAILQRRMLNTPLASMDIRLQESHEGGVEVMVGRKRYETVDEVPDPEIKSAIRAAIDEWEKKYTPGL